MTWIVPWNGVEVDADPYELDGFELGLIKQRTGLSFRDLLEGVGNLDGEAVRALFWALDRRQNEELKFSDYHGPKMGLIVEHLDDYIKAAEAPVGKALAKISTSETAGTDDSASPADSSPEINITL